MNLMTASNQWAHRPADQRFETLTALRDSVHGRRLRSRSTDLDLNRIHVSAEGDSSLVINSGISPAEPTHWAFGQFAGLLKAPANYLRNLPVELTVQCLNAGIAAAPREAVKFMTVAPADGADGGSTLQAVTSPTYGRIWDADCVEAVMRIVEKSAGKFHNPLAYVGGLGGEVRPSGLYASDHDVFMFMIDGGSRLEAGPRAQLHRGFITWNSETGAKTFGLMTFLFNEVCGNHIIYGAQQINQLLIRHTHGGPARFDAEAAPMLAAYANASAAPELAAIKRAQDYLLPAGTKGLDLDKLDTLLNPFRLTKGEVREAVATAEREEGECRTLWQLEQGLTAYARGFDFIDSRVDLERRAGKLLELVAD